MELRKISRLEWKIFRPHLHKYSAGISVYSVLLTPRHPKLVRSSRQTWRKRYCILYFAGLRMHARVSQLHFFAYESKLRYVRDSPEGAVKYSRQSPRRAAHPRTAAAKRRNPYYPRYTLLLYTPTYLPVLCATSVR